MRAAFSDLDLYLNSKEVRDEHYEQQRKRCINLVQENGLPSRVIRVDLEWLRSQVDKLKTLRERCEKLVESHTHAVVYAVKFKTILGLSSTLRSLRTAATLGVTY